MSGFTIVMYGKPNGEVPTIEFLESLDRKMKAKMHRAIDYLEETGNMARMPFSEPLRDGIFELRAQSDGNVSRVLYFFYVEKTIVLTHGFVKKTNQTPSEEIERAKKYRDDYLGRIEQ